MIPLLKAEIVDKHKWIEPEEFVELLALAQSSPGPVIINTSIFTGYKIAGFWGSIATAAGSAMPSFLIILLVAMYFTDIRTNTHVDAVFKALKPAIPALILAPVWRMAKEINAGLGTAVIIALVVLAVGVFKMSAIHIIIVSILISLLIKKEENKE